MKSSIGSLLHVLAISLILLLAPRIIRGTLPPPLPLDDPPPETDVRAMETVYFADTTQVSVRSSNGRFRLVGLHLNEAVNVVLQFPPGWANALLAIQALDGGSVCPQTMQTTTTIEGTASFQFQAGNQPGLYRIVLIGAAGSSTLSFWVVDPANLQTTPPVVNAPHQEQAR